MQPKRHCPGNEVEIKHAVEEQQEEKPEVYTKTIRANRAQQAAKELVIEVANLHTQFSHNSLGNGRGEMGAPSWDPAQL